MASQNDAPVPKLTQAATQPRGRGDGEEMFQSSSDNAVRKERLAAAGPREGQSGEDGNKGSIGEQKKLKNVRDEAKENNALSQRLRAIRERLAAGREENIQAVNEEVTGKEKSERVEEDNDSSAKRTRRRRADGADEADGEDDDEQLRAMKRRARFVPVSAEKDETAGASLTYGGAGHVDDKAVGRMVAELENVQKRRERYGRRRAVNDESSAITFINEGNRLFNRTLERHYDKFEAVQKIKDDLERGSA